MRNAVIAIHDAAPGWESEVVSIMNTVNETLPTARPALLTVPDFHGKAPLRESVSFLCRLKQWVEDGCEPVLHGFYHLAETPVARKRHPMRWALSRTLTAGEGEFLDLDSSKIQRRIAEGREQLETLLKVPICGFVPPAWLRNGALFPALRTQKFAYTEGHIYLYDLSERRRLRAPALGFSGRTPSGAAASVRFARALQRAPLHLTDLRVAIHPADFTVPSLKSAITALLLRIGETHRIVTYKEMLRS